MTPLPDADCRIHVNRRTARWDDRPVTAAEAMDFWSFAGAAANVIMQMAWPEVGHGVVESKVESGSLMKHPWKRLRTTSQYLAVAVLGSEEDRDAFRKAVDGAHREVKSTPESPVRYNAFDRDLQMWVAACLFVGLEDTYHLLRGEMTAEQAEQFYRSAWTLGTTLQVTEDQWPPTREAFDAYWNSACERVAIDDVVRRYLLDLINLQGSWRRCFATRWACDGAPRVRSCSKGCSCSSLSRTGSFRCSSAKAAVTSCWSTCGCGPTVTKRWCERRAAPGPELPPERRSAHRGRVLARRPLRADRNAVGVLPRRAVRTHLEMRLPAGADLGAYGLVAALWPVELFITTDVCAI